MPDPLWHDSVSRMQTMAVRLVAALAFAGSMHFGTYVPWGTDAAGYVEAARRWTRGELAAPSLSTPGVLSGAATFPLGFRPGLEPDTNVSVYPPGYPILMAAAWTLGGEWAAYLVVPVFTAVLVYSAAQIAAAIGGAWAGLLAAILTAASPVTLVSAVQPMSDVPAAACWLLAWALSLRSGVGAGAAAGAAAAMAIVIRPNLAPLGIVPAGLLWAGAKDQPVARRLRRLAVFGAGAALGPALVAWSQAVLYGHPLEPGYPGWEEFYRTAHVSANVANYSRFLFAVHTPLMVAGLATPLLRQGVRLDDVPTSRRAAWSAVTFAVVAFAVYLPYTPYDDPHYLRFMLPAVVALFALLAAGTVLAGRVLARYSPAVVAVALLPALLVMAAPTALFAYVRTLGDGQRRVVLMGRYLRQALPRNAAVLAVQQSGAIAHYTHAPIARYDPLAGAALDEVVAELSRLGYRPVLVVDEGFELASFRARFAESSLGRLEWAPRARARDAVSSLLYFDFADRAGAARDVAHAIDVVTAP